MSHTRYPYSILGSLLLLISILSLSSAVAQPPCRCTAPDTTVSMVVDVNGVNRLVDVTYCQDNYCPVNDGITYCTMGNSVHARTVISGMCITDALPTLSAQALFDAVRRRMDICCGEHVFPVCIFGPRDVYNWLVSIPVCVRADATGRCYTACEDSPCCTSLVSFSLTSAGICVTNVVTTCEEAGQCGNDCERLECYYPTCLR